MATIILDAGHGGNDLGDAYGNRFEKNDNLRLTLAVGEELEKYGYQVEYTRITDMYLSQFDRVDIANNIGGDFLLTIHRVVGELPLSEGGLGFYVNERGGVAEEAAVNIADALFPLGFCNYSIEVRSELPILSRTNMPALMLGIGYMNSEADNQFFDDRLNDIAAAIALGIYNTIPVENFNNFSIPYTGFTVTDYNGNTMNYTVFYGVQIGLFSEYNNAETLRDELLMKGYEAFLDYREPYYRVIVGAYDDLDAVAQLEFRLNLEGYDTLIVEL